MSRRRRRWSPFDVMRGAVAALCVGVIGFCAWSMNEYLEGRDPLVGLPFGQYLSPAPATAEATPAPQPVPPQPAPRRASIVPRDVRDELTHLQWHGDDVSVPAGDTRLVVDYGGIWVEHRENDGVAESLDVVAEQLSALAAWSRESGVDVPSLTWIEETEQGAVRVVITIDPQALPADAADAADVLGAAQGYAVSDELWEGAHLQSVSDHAGTAPTLPDGKTIVV